MAAPTVTTASTSGTIGLTLSYQVIAPGATSFACGALPANGLTLNGSTGVISGAPAATGTTAYTVSATNSSGTGTGTITIQVVSPPAGCVWDGDFSQPLPCGCPIVTYPFQNLGDVTTIIVRQPLQQDLSVRAPLTPGALNPDPNYSNTYAFDDSEPMDYGARIGRWMRSFASIPANPITTLESFSFAFQKYTFTSTTSASEGSYDPSSGTTSGSSSSSTYSYSLSATSLSVSSRVVREYFLAGNEASFPLLNNPKMDLISPYQIQKLGTGSLYAATLLPGVFISDDGPNFLAEPNKYETWHYPIRCRVSRYINAPTLAFWGGEYNFASFTVSPTSATISEEVTLTLTGTNTNWTSSTTFGCSAGAVNTNSVNVSAQTATVTFTAPTSAQKVNFAGSDNSFGVNSVTVTTS